MSYLLDETRYAVWHKSFISNLDKCYIDKVVLQERIGTNSIYTTRGHFVGSIGNPEMREEIVKRFNEENKFLEEYKEDLKVFNAFRKVMEKYSITEPEYLDRTLKRAMDIETKMRGLVSKMQDIAGMSDDEVIQDVCNNIINKFKSLM